MGELSGLRRIVERGIDIEVAAAGLFELAGDKDAAHLEQRADPRAKFAVLVPPPIDHGEGLLMLADEGNDAFSEVGNVGAGAPRGLRRCDGGDHHRAEFGDHGIARDGGQFIHVADVAVDGRLRHAELGGDVDRGERIWTRIAQQRSRFGDYVVSSRH